MPSWSVCARIGGLGMPRKRTMITDAEEAPRGQVDGFTTEALINGDVVEVPVSAIRFDFDCFTDRQHANAALYLWRGLTNGDRRFIPILFPRGDGALLVTGFISRQH